MSVLVILLATTIGVGLLLGLVAKQTPMHLVLQIGAMCAATLVFYMLVRLLG